MDLNEMRERINNIDDQLAELFVQRMGIAAQIAGYKRSNNVPVFSAGREREILTRVTGKTGPELEMYAKVLFNTIFDISKSYQLRLLSGQSKLLANIKEALEKTPREFPNKAVVACQGVEGAFSQQACDRLFPLADIFYFSRFEGVFKAVSKGMCQYGILPIENSSAGSVTEVYDLMEKYRFHIVRSVRLKIEQCLLAPKGTELKHIKEVFSHEQAISQCSEYLKKFPDIKITFIENTAAAARMIAQSGRSDVAAISSLNCAQLYELNVLDRNIQNSDHNYTRFICISRDLEIYPGADHLSLMLTVPHTPGSLYQLIAKIATRGLNLEKLESRPIPGKDFEFRFYVDIGASIYSEDVLSLISQLENDLDSFTFLGAYGETG
ncbi:MAG: bifunctional chorismate mutase/prephenate dehydratase [Oscillospiraceae bacterium]|jgi:chorismate mutase/prephenate dehydratase